MDNQQTIILKSFNKRFLQALLQLKEFLPNFLPIILLIGGVEFCIEQGNPELPLILFRMAIYPVKDMIYEENEKILDPDFLQEKIKTTMEEMRKIKLIDVKVGIPKLKQNVLDGRQAWDNFSTDKKKNFWNDLKIITKLSEKIRI